MPTMNPEQKLMEGSNLVIGILMHRTYRHPLFFLASLKQPKYENTTVIIKIQTETPYNQAKGDSAMLATKVLSSQNNCSNRFKVYGKCH